MWHMGSLMHCTPVGQRGHSPLQGRVYAGWSQWVDYRKPKQDERHAAQKKTYKDTDCRRNICVPIWITFGLLGLLPSLLQKLYMHISCSRLAGVNQGECLSPFKTSQQPHLKQEPLPTESLKGSIPVFQLVLATCADYTEMTTVLSGPHAWLYV